MTTVKMNAPHSAGWQGQQFDIVNGIANVPAAAVEDMKSHGWTVFIGEEKVGYEHMTLEQLIEEGAKRKLGPNVLEIKEKIIQMLTEHDNDQREEEDVPPTELELQLEALDKLRSKDDVRKFADEHKITLVGIEDKLVDLKDAVTNSLKAASMGKGQ